MSAGFGETRHAPEAGQRQEGFGRRPCVPAGIRLIGPNCVGVMDAVSGFNTNFDIGSYPRGGISVLTQSGAFGNSFLFASGTTGRVGLNKFVSMGNMADVQMAELLAFLKDDNFHAGHRNLSGRPLRSAPILRSRPRGRRSQAGGGA